VRHQPSSLSLDRRVLSGRLLGARETMGIDRCKQSMAAGRAPVQDLRERLRRGPLPHEEGQRLRDWSAWISGSSAAQYLPNVGSSLDGAVTPRQALWLVCRPASPPMTMGSDGPRNGDDLATT